MSTGWILTISFAVTFISTFSGVFLAYFLGTRRDRVKRREEDDSKRVMAQDSIANELRNVLKDAKLYLERVAQPHPGTFQTLSPFTDAKDATIGSGTFALIEPELQEQISYVYVMISQGHDQMRRIRDFDAGFGLTLPNHVKFPMLAAMENQLVEIVNAIPDRLPELIRWLTEAPTPTSENVNDECGPPP